MRDFTAADVERFWTHVVRGPGARDCWIWVGSIGDDGYGRWWAKDERGHQRVLRPHRVALALSLHVDVDSLDVVEHLVCDNPLCVRASGDLGDHLAASNQRSNIAHAAARGRRGGRPLFVRLDHPTKEVMAARSRALRDAVRGGWDTERIEGALLGNAPSQGHLW